MYVLALLLYREEFITHRTVLGTQHGVGLVWVLHILYVGTYCVHKIMWSFSYGCSSGTACFATILLNPIAQNVFVWDKLVVFMIDNFY